MPLPGVEPAAQARCGEGAHALADENGQGGVAGIGGAGNAAGSALAGWILMRRISGGHVGRRPLGRRLCMSEYSKDLASEM